MDEIDNVRQGQLRELLSTRFGGVQRDLAEAIGREPNYVSRMLSNARHRKGIGEDVARDIEKRLGLPRGWMDGEARDSIVPIHGAGLSREAAEVARKWQRVPEPMRTQLAGFIEALVVAPATPKKRARAAPLGKRPAAR